MDQIRIRELQFQQLKIMDEIHRICIENDLKYYMIGGSALGAVRHKGFIPWDIDIDIAMPRSDYEKFLQIVSRVIDDKFLCHDYKRDKIYSSPHAMVEMKNSILKYSFTDLNPTIGPQGIYVDILPLDIVSSNLEEQALHAKKLNRIKWLKTLKQSKIYPNNTFAQKITKHLIRIMLLPISWYYLNDKQQKTAQMYSHVENPTLCCSTLSHYKYKKLTMPISYYGKPTLMKFEDRMYFCPEHVEKYLCHIFGDYQKLPPIQDRLESMNSIIEAEWQNE